MKEEEENLLGTIEISTQSAKNYQRLLHLLLIGSVSFNVLLMISGILISGTRREPVIGVSYENGFASDLEPVKSEIELIVKPFSGGVELNGEKNFVTDQGGREYIGPPSPGIDQAWDLLLEGLNLDFNQQEIDLAGSTFQWPESGFYFSGLDVYHSLHCLNRLRQAIYPDYYTTIFGRPTDPSRDNHIGHCVNQIRQALQCHSDLTPMEWRLDGSKIILKTNTRHTCRNFDKIHSWAASHRTKFESIASWKNGSLIIVD